LLLLLLLLQGGISNGEDIVIKVAFKPTSTIGIKQQTVTREGGTLLSHTQHTHVQHSNS
jgi:chorismate synthase